MVGLNELGEMAWQCEQVLNKWLKDERPATHGAARLHRPRARLVRRTGSRSCKQSGAARIDGTEHQAPGRALKSGEAPAPVEAPAAVAEVPRRRSKPPPRWKRLRRWSSNPRAQRKHPRRSRPRNPPPKSVSIRSISPPPRPSPRPPWPSRYRPKTRSEPAELSFDLEPAPAQIAQPAPEIAELAPLEAAAEAAAARRHDGGGRGHRLARPLLDLHRRSRAAHRLDGTARCPRWKPTRCCRCRRTSCGPRTPLPALAHHGIHGLAELAHSLEKWLQEAIDLPPEFDANRLSGTRRGVDALAAMVQSVRGQALPHERNDVIEVIEALREGLRQSRRTGEGTHLRMPGLVADEAPVVAEIPAPVVEAPAPVVAPPAPVVAAPAPVAEAPAAPVIQVAPPVVPAPVVAQPAPVASIEPPPPPSPPRRNSRRARTNARSRTTSTATCCRSSSRKRARSSRW